MSDEKIDPRPLVSIVIPVYNGSDYLHEAIDCALNQSYTNCEVIVVNDGSIDNGATRAVAMSFIDRIKYFEKENGGVATALNLGIHNAQGEYISWLSHDDLYFPTKIERQINFLNTLTSRNVIIYCDYEAIDVETNEVSQHSVCHIEPYDYLQDMIILLLKSQLHGCSLLLPKCCFSEVTYFDSQFRTTQDYHMWFRLLRGGYRFVHLPEVLVRARWHKGQGSRGMNDIHLREREDLYLWVAEQFFEDITTFSSRVVSDIVAFERGAHEKFVTYIMDRIRKENPVLYWKLLARKRWVCIKSYIRWLLTYFLRRVNGVLP